METAGRLSNHLIALEGLRTIGLPTHDLTGHNILFAKWVPPSTCCCCTVTCVRRWNRR